MQRFAVLVFRGHLTGTCKMPTTAEMTQNGSEELQKLVQSIILTGHMVKSVSWYPSVSPPQAIGGATTPLPAAKTPAGPSPSRHRLRLVSSGSGPWRRRSRPYPPGSVLLWGSGTGQWSSGMARLPSAGFRCGAHIYPPTPRSTLRVCTTTTSMPLLCELIASG